ncbi:MAG: 4'-phosphopantetheinyl transferase superfamily protein [Bacteroidota bacterium]
MPHTLYEHSFPLGELGLWAIKESESWFLERLELHAEELMQLNAIKGEGRRLEFLAARLLLHRLSHRKRRGALVKDEYGKPRLENSPYYISISHTSGMSAAFAHPSACGVDVQRLVHKIHRIAPKFINEREAKTLHPEDEHRLLIEQHLIWSAKEAMYKAYGRKQIDFKAHLTVDLVDTAKQSGQMAGRLHKDGLEIDYDLDFRVLDEEIVLVVAVERRRNAG